LYAREPSRTPTTFFGATGGTDGTGFATGTARWAVRGVRSGESARRSGGLYVCASGLLYVV
jgi:hypothetical protein